MTYLKKFTITVLYFEILKSHALKNTMTNFNSINNFNNIRFTPAQNPAGMVEGSQIREDSTEGFINQTFRQTEAQNLINPSLIYDFQSAKMDSEALLKYLQSLLNLPNTIDKFVSQTLKNSLDEKVIKALVENMVNTAAIKEFLNQSSIDAISKLMQIIAIANKTNPSSLKELKEVLNILTAIQTAATDVNTNSLKELLLLYIPLNYQIFDKKDNIEIKDEEQKEAIQNAQLSILFQTVNFSNMLITLNEENNELFVDIYTGKTFPFDKFLSIISSFSKETNLLIQSELRKIYENEDERKNDNQNFRIISDGFVSINVLILSHLIIKMVFKIDDDYSII